MKTYWLFLIALGVLTVSTHGLGISKRFVVFRGNLAAAELELKRHGVNIIKHLKHGRAMVVEGEEALVRDAAGAIGVSYEEDFVYSIGPEMLKASGAGKSAPTQPPQSVPWGIAKIRANQAASRGAGVMVCVSDTGIQLNHPDLAANIISGFNAIDPAKSANDDNGHGTHVAGTIAALDNAIGVIGVAPEAKLIAAKGLNRRGSGWSSDLAETIDMCQSLGAKVINMSWGSSQASTIIHDALIRAFNVGILLIAAAGNSSGAVSYPAAFPEVIAVSAVDSLDRFASFSSYGPEVENSAPGVSIYSTYKGSSYATLSGTSMAAPHVSGVAALILSTGLLVGRDNLVGVDIGLPIVQQGTRGRIDAVLSEGSVVP